MASIKTSGVAVSAYLMLVLVIKTPYKTSGYLAISPSPRAAVCQVGDSLEVTCTTSDRFLTWTLTKSGSIGRITRTLSSTIRNPEVVVVNSTVFTFLRTSELGSTPLTSTLKIGSVSQSLNGTKIVCTEVGASAMMANTTVYIIGDKHTNCGNPLDRSRFNISNVQAIGNSIPALEGDDVTFSCPFGLQINGSNTSTCMGNGKWEPDPQEVECIEREVIVNIVHTGSTSGGLFELMNINHTAADFNISTPRKNHHGVKMIIGITMMGALIAVGFIAFTVAVAVVKRMKLKDVLGMNTPLGIFQNLFILFILLCVLDIATMNSNSNVTLSVTLLYGKVSYPGDVVTCICVTRGSLSIVWYSNEYIGAVGSAQVKFTSDDIGNQQVINSSTVATLVSAEVDNGTQILTSQLRITVSSDYQNPSVTCGGLSNETISFEVLVGNVHLISSVRQESNVYPVQLPIMFTCITRDSSFVDWRYNNNEDHVSVPKSYQLGQPVYAGSNYFYVTLVNITHTNTNETILLSKLYLNELIDNVITITCRNGDHQRSTNITVYRSGQPPVQLHVQSNQSCINSSYYVQFICIVGSSSSLQWSSEQFGTINCSRDNCQSDGIHIMSQISCNNTGGTCTSTLSLSAEDLPADGRSIMTCRNNELRSEENITYVAPPDCPTDPSTIIPTHGGSPRVMVSYHKLAATMIPLWLYIWTRFN